MRLFMFCNGFRSIATKSSFLPINWSLIRELRTLLTSLKLIYSLSRDAVLTAFNELKIEILYNQSLEKAIM
jgi:hypothetical protein